MSGNKKSKRYGFLSGFLGMDNISCVDRSNPPRGVSITQVRRHSLMLINLTLTMLTQCGRSAVECWTLDRVQIPFAAVSRIGNFRCLHHTPVHLAVNMAKDSGGIMSE